MNSIPRRWVATVALVASLAPMACAFVADVPKPNFVFILMDNLGYY